MLVPHDLHMYWCVLGVYCGAVIFMILRITKVSLSSLAIRDQSVAGQTPHLANGKCDFALQYGVCETGG